MADNNNNVQDLSNTDQYQQMSHNNNYNNDSDLLDILPPEIIELILLHLDHPTLFSCATLSKRWAQRVIPQLWHSPYMAYYVSWMKFLKTISTAGNNNNNKSPKNTSLKKFKSTSNSSSPSQSPDMGSISSPSLRQSPGRNHDDTVVQDPYGRFEGTLARLTMSGGSTVRGFPSDNRSAENESNGSGSSSEDQKQEDNDDDDDDEGDEDDDDDDGDMSGLLRLAESQRQNQVQVGWGGNCTSEREVSTHGFTFHAREIFSPTLSSSSSSSSPTSSPRSYSANSYNSDSSSNSSSISVGRSNDTPGKTDKLGLNISTESTSNNNHTSSMVVACTEKHTICRNEGDNMITASTTTTTTTTTTTPQSQPQHQYHQHQQTTLIAQPTTTTTSFILRPFAYGALIRVLDFSHLYYIVSDKFLTHLLPQTPLLLELVIHSPKQFSDESLISLSKSCLLLRRLELVGCTKISDLGLEVVLDACQNISMLVISNNGPAGITDKTLSQLSMATFPLSTKQQQQQQQQSISPSSSPSQTQEQGQQQAQVQQDLQLHSLHAQRLRVLNLSSASNFITGQNPGLMSIAIWCMNLVSLDISHCTQSVTDELLRLVSKTSPVTETKAGAATSSSTCLKRLNIAHCSQVTNKGLFYLARGCPDLRQLDITAVHLVDDQGILEIAKHCRSFKKLVMDDKFGTRITRDILKSFPSWSAEVVRQGMTFERRGSRTF